jgi:hypothetical protein
VTVPGGSLPPLSLAVVGAPYGNADGFNRQFEILLCAPGEEVDLRPEPRNKHDRHAIAVHSCRGVQIGYLTAERAPLLGTLLGRTEVRAVFQRKAPFGAWIRVAFEGEVPVLTQAMLAEHGEPEEAAPEFDRDEDWTGEQWADEDWSNEDWPSDGWPGD